MHVRRRSMAQSIQPAMSLKTLTSLNKEVRPFFFSWATIAFGAFPLFLPLAITAFGGPEGYFSLAVIAFGAFQFIVPKDSSFKEVTVFKESQGAPKERRRGRAQKRLSKRVFLESPFLLCPLYGFLLKHLKDSENLKGAEKKRTLQKHAFGQPFLRTTPSPLLWRPPREAQVAHNPRAGSGKSSFITTKLDP